ncbi:MAG: hypothetical protein QOH67_3839, partial [Hyphomicrobiales bacterium]|nr:hypothetical protein [Hyphomicrobiales bacterium]
MTHPVLADVLADASNPGPTYGPGDLLTAIAAIERPMELLSSWDRCQSLCSTFDHEYGFIQLARVAGVRPSNPDMKKWSALLRWVLDELSGWSANKDTQQRALAAVFIAGTMSDIDHELWKLLPNPFGMNQRLVEMLQAMLKACKVVIDAPLHVREPIFTKAAIERFSAANAVKDWKEINECLDGFGDYISASPLQTQATRILLRCGKDGFMSVLAGVDDALLATSFVGAIGDEDTCLELAVACNSQHFEFAALRGSANRRQSAPMGSAANSLLVKLSADPRRWHDLMDIFNRYPVRYPRLQKALGRALASVPLAAIQDIAAIHLHDVAFDDGGRDNVAACLRAFREQATRDQREAMWRLAYDRWSAWDFARSESETNLLQIRGSVLDYAIVGYAIECLDINTAAKTRSDILTRCLGLHQNWYVSATAMTTGWNRCLSSFQPFGHGEHILSGSDE